MVAAGWRCHGQVCFVAFESMCGHVLTRCRGGMAIPANHGQGPNLFQFPSRCPSQPREIDPPIPKFSSLCPNILTRSTLGISLQIEKINRLDCLGVLEETQAMYHVVKKKKRLSTCMFHVSSSSDHECVKWCLPRASTHGDGLCLSNFDRFEKKNKKHHANKIAHVSRRCFASIEHASANHASRVALLRGPFRQRSEPIPASCFRLLSSFSFFCLHRSSKKKSAPKESAPLFRG